MMTRKTRTTDENAIIGTIPCMIPVTMAPIISASSNAHGLRNEMVRRFSGRKGGYRKISGVLEDPVHTRLIPAIRLECATRKGGVSRVGTKGHGRESHQFPGWKVARRVWSSLDWLNARPSGLLADASERWLKRWTRRESGLESLPLSPPLLADPHYEGIRRNGRPGARSLSFLLKMRECLHRKFLQCGHDPEKWRQQTWFTHLLVSRCLKRSGTEISQG